MFRKLVLLCVVPAALGAQQAGPPPIPPGTFRPISLVDAINLAKENNVQAITAANSIRTANNNVRATRALLWPDLRASAGQSRSAGQRPGQTGELVPYTSAWSYSTGLSTGITLFDGGKTFSDIKRSQADVANAETDQVVALATLAFTVKQQYNSVLAANEGEAAARAQLELANQQLAVAVARVNAGAANIADSLNAVVGVGNGTLAILTAQQTLRAASASLTRSVGTPYLVTAIPADTAEIAHTPIDSAAVMQMALQGPAIRAYQTQLTANEATRRSAKAAYLPTISAGLGVSGGGTSNVYGFGGPRPYSYNRSISFSASYPIFNRYGRENQIQAAEITIENTQAQLKDQQFANQQTVIVQMGALRNAEEQIRVQQISIRASEEALRVNQQRYALGAGTLVDVLQSQGALIGARQQLINARLSYRNARAQLEQVIGRDLP